MFILKLEQNLFHECSPDKIFDVKEEHRGESVFRTLSVDFYPSVDTMTVERRKYPYFFKYYLYWDGDLWNPIDFKTEEAAVFLLAFYKKYCPHYVKNPLYKAEDKKELADYFYTERIPGESMQHYGAGGKTFGETCPKASEKQEEKPAVSTLEGYHEFNEEEKKDIGGQLDALKAQFADQLAELSGLLKEQKGE